MALLAVKSPSPARYITLGAIKLQVYNYTIQSGDTSGIIIPDSVTQVLHVFASGYLGNIEPTISGINITFNFTDPTSTKSGSILIFGT